MSQDPFKILGSLLSPRYREEGPPAYIEKFLTEEFLDKDGRVSEPMKTALDLIVLGYRPVTALCILTVFVENKNKPCSGRQLGLQLEKKLDLEEGKLTRGRYYDDRIGRLLKIMCLLGVLEHEERLNAPGAREGYRINKPIFPLVEKRIGSFLNGQSLSPFVENIPTSEVREDRAVKHCSKCGAMITSRTAIYCELCGAPLTVFCKKCGKEALCKWTFCNHCAAPLHIRDDGSVRGENVKQDV